MIGHCKLDCTEGLDYCCICCPKKEECKTQCGDLDKVQKLLYERQNIIILRNMKQNKGFEEESIL